VSVAFTPLALAIATTALSTSLQAAEPARLETVLVRAQQVQLELEAQQKLVPGGVTLIDGAELQQRNMTTMADMLRYVPGVWVASGSTANSTFFSSRGSNLDATNYDGNGIKLMQDGLPVSGADGNNHNRDVDPLSARYVVVARGANALTYGASTLGGAIDFITPTAHDTPSQLYVAGGSDGQIEGRVTAGTVAGRFDGLFTAEARRYDGYREHQRQEREALYANAGWQFSDDVRTRLYLTYIDNDQQLPGGLTRAQWQDNPEQAEGAAVAGNYRLNVESWRIADKTTWDIDENSSLSFGLSYEWQELYHPIVYAPPFFSLLIDTTQKNAGATLRYNLRAGDHDLLAGVNYGETRVTGGNYFYHPTRFTDLMADVDNKAGNTEIFLVDRWQFAPQWTLLYGAQGVIGSREASNTDAKGDYDSINPRIGLTYQVAPSVELFSNISKLYEAPTLYELEDDACACADALDAMQGYVFEVGTRGSQPFGKANTWNWEVAAYYAQLQDEILSIDDPLAPGTSLSSNVDDTIHAGIEALFGASFALGGGETHRIEPLVNITINDFSFDDDATYGNNDLPVAPGYFIKGEILYRHASGFFAGPTFDIVDKRYADFANSYIIDAYELLGLRAGFTQPNWEVWAELRNLTDEDYISVVSVRNVAGAGNAILYPGESRAASVGVRFEF
jgi:iron complex outermembrane receptor protein